MKLLLGILLVVSHLHAEPRDLKAHYEQLKIALVKAENTPGQGALDEMRYYQGELDKIEKELKKSGVSFVPYEQTTLFSESFSPEYSDSTTAKRLQDLVLELPHTILQKELDAVDLELAKLSRGQGSVNDVNELLAKRYNVSQKIQHIKENPALVSQSIKNLETQEDFLKKTPSHIAMLQESLQKLYIEIYSLRAKSLHAQNGDDIYSYGVEITKLETKEKELKHRLRKLGAEPNPPEILESDMLKRLSKGAGALSFEDQIEGYLTELDQKISAVHAELAEAKSGGDIARLGLKMRILQQQRSMSQQVIQDKKPEKEPSAPPASPQPPAQPLWGGQSTAQVISQEDSMLIHTPSLNQDSLRTVHRIASSI